MPNTSERSGGSEQSGGLVKYGLSRALVLFLVLLIVPYLIVAVMNRDGALDEMRVSQIRYEVVMLVYDDPDLQGLSPAERERLIDELVQKEYRHQGLDRPFVIRSFSHLWWAVSLDLGRNSPVVGLPVEVRSILAERSGPTFLLLGTAMILLLLISFFVARAASRRPGRWLDRLVLRLASISALPAWFFGVFLILIFPAWLEILPWGRMVPVPPPVARGEYILSVLRHLILPVSAILLGSIFAATYSWRTFFVGHSSDAHVEPAGGSESPGREVDRSAFLRPTPAHISKHFLLLAASVLTVSIVLEVVFNWPGLGRLLYQGILLKDTPVVLGALVIYGYVLALLVVIVFSLDFLDVWLMQRRGRVASQGGE